MSGESNAPFSGQPASGDFTTTQWSVVLLAGRGAAEALERLCGAYWPPLYAYARRDGLNAEDAEDAVQDFIVMLLGREDLASVSPDKGRFRSFLLAALRHFLTSRARSVKAVKRGGGRPALCIDDLGAEELCRPELTDGYTAERAFDRQWARTIMARALQRLGAEQRDPRQQELLRALRPMLAESGRLSGSEALAASLGITSGALAMAATRLRQRYRALIEHEVAHTLTGSDQLAEEMRVLREAWT